MKRIDHPAPNRTKYGFRNYPRCARVPLYALAIADELGFTDKDMDALGAAVVFHDSRRQDDWMDVGHGQRTAGYYREYAMRINSPWMSGRIS